MFVMGGGAGVCEACSLMPEVCSMAGNSCGVCKVRAHVVLVWQLCMVHTLAAMDCAVFTCLHGWFVCHPARRGRDVSSVHMVWLPSPPSPHTH